MEVLRERESELDELRQATSDASAGHGRLVLVEGVGGIGKSRLLQAVRELAAEARMRSFSATGAEIERTFTFGVVRQLLGGTVRALRDERAAVFDGAAQLAAPIFDGIDDGTVSGPDRLFGRMYGLTWLVANLADRNPVALLVDDAQWADDTSLAALAFLARRLDEHPVLLVLASRPIDGSVAAELARLPHTVVVRPRALSAAAVETWVADALSSAPDPGFVDAVVQATGGNPFLVSELIHEVDVGGLSPAASGSRAVAALGPRSVADAILARVGYLPAAAADIANALALLGDGRTLSELIAFTGLDADEAAGAAAALERAGIVDAAAGVRFVHPIIRQAVHQRLPAVQRDVEHRRAASFLRSRGARASEVAAHLLEAEPQADEDAVTVLVSAARDAVAAGDPRTASELLRRALREPPSEAMRPGVVRELASTAALAGDPDALDLLTEAVLIGRSPAERSAAALELLAHMVPVSGSGNSVDLLLDAVDDLPNDDPLAEIADAALALSANGRITVRRQVLPRLQALPVPPGAPVGVREWAALIFRAYHLAADLGRPREAAALARRALAVERPEVPPALGNMLRNVAAVSLLAGEDVVGAEAVWSALVDASRSAGSPSGVAMYLSPRALVRWRAGAVAAAEADATEALELQDEIVGAEAVRGVSATIAVCAGIELGRPLAELRALVSLTPDLDVLAMFQLCLGKGALLLALDEPAAALEQFATCDRDEPGLGRDCPTLLPWRSGAALALAALGRAEEGEALALREAELAQSAGTHGAHGVALCVAARVGDPARRRARLQAAVTTLEHGPSRLELARALFHLGADIRRAGESSASRPVLLRAHELATVAGSTRIAGAARTELRISGVRVRARRQDGPGSLTASERRVADLAANGRTNREIAQELFLSTKTIETHLRSVFRKLDVTSRHRLATQLTS